MKRTHHFHRSFICFLVAAAVLFATVPGHSLNLMHLQNSDANLMRSKTYGWQLHPGEIKIARENAQNLAVAETDRRSCTVRIHNNP